MTGQCAVSLVETKTLKTKHMATGGHVIVGIRATDCAAQFLDIPFDEFFQFLKENTIIK